MDVSLQSKINDLISNGYQVEIGKYISMAWGNFKKAPGQYIGYLVVFFAIMVALSIVPMGTLLSPLFTIGFAIVANKIQRGEQVEFGRFFDGFKSNPGHLLLVGLIMGLLIVLAMIPGLVIGGVSMFGLISDLDSGMAPDLSAMNIGLMTIAGLLAMIPAIYLGIAWSWSYYFVAFKGLDFWPAMEASRKIITKEWFSFFGFSLVLGLIAVAGVLCFGVGLLVAIPVISIASFIAFEQIIGLNDEHEIDLIDHLIDDEV